ncbi:hypothetical protein EB796_009216 [Bugula neritina]|uniref:Condensin-2 complex subunit H2 C-terminal domain-containing protein n=1 Tax=Bugula neritina TaxID=10212 RepID=A0A7J7K4E9_BUGNE|nr:hypothetical protein EB796_009216 [Bugula neritina]
MLRAFREVEKKRKCNRSKDQQDDAHLIEEEENDLDLSICEDDRIQLMESDELLFSGAVVIPPKPSMLTSNFNVKIPLRSLAGDVIGYMNDFNINFLDAPTLPDSSLLTSPYAENPTQPDGANNNTAAEHDAADAEGGFIDGECEPPMEASNLATPCPSEMTPVCQEKLLRSRNVPSPVIQPAQRPSKVLKPGNCRVLPPSLRKGKKRELNSDKCSDKTLDGVATFCNKEYSYSLLNTGRDSLLYPEFKVLFADILRKRLIKFRSLRMKSTRQPAHAGQCQPDDLPVEDWMGEDGEDDSGACESDDEIPFSRLQGGDIQCQGESSKDELPAGYSDFLAKALQRECDELATQTGKLTDIDRRVKQWENNVRGAIEQAETRPAFDMLHYSRCIFDSFADNDTVFMEEVLTGKPKYEAFRTFVSALILANHGNIDIVETDGGQVELSLLNKTTLSEKLASDAISSTSTVINKETVT